MTTMTTQMIIWWVRETAIRSKKIPMETLRAIMERMYEGSHAHHHYSSLLEDVKHGHGVRVANLQSNWKNLRVRLYDINGMLASSVMCTECCECCIYDKECPREYSEPVIHSKVLDQDHTKVYAQDDCDGGKSDKEAECAEQLWAASSDWNRHVGADEPAAAAMAL